MAADAIILLPHLAAPLPATARFLPPSNHEDTMLQDALRKALTGKDLKASEPSSPTPPPKAAGPSLPHPEDHEWGRLLQGVPAGASLGRWRQESQARIKTWKKAGRKHDARTLEAAQTKFEKQFEKAAWRAIKDRWTTLTYPAKMYRRLKSASIDPSKVVERLHTRRAEAMATAGSAALWTWVTTGKTPG